MATEASKPASSADSYIGSLISLTSKSEIRYEGILYSIDTEESSIGLRNVRSFGSEGRKKDGPQIPPSDRVYEYILFRGTDIKDLQVKSSPPTQATPSIDNDPAIIQSHYPRPSVPPTSFPPSIGVSPTDANTHAPQLGHNGSNFPGGISLYQPGANMGSWVPSPPPSINGNPLPMPMYWPGMYGPPSGLPHMQQQTLLRPPSGLLVPPSLQQPMQYPGFNAPPQAAAPNVPSSDSNLLNTSRSSTVLGFTAPQPVGPLNVPGSGSPLLATSSSSSAFSTASLPPFSLPAAPSVITASETPSSSVLNKGSNSALSSTALSVGLPNFASLAISDSETSSSNPPVSSMMNTVLSSTLPYQNLSQDTISVVASSSPGQSEVLAPSLVTPDQLLQPGQLQISSQSEISQKDVEVVEASSLPKQAASSGKEKEAQPPILPLPPASRTYHKPNGASQMHHNYGGSARGRGSGGSRPVTRFTEDFDFTAMNEKFNKDEVWGHLGRSKNKEGDENDDAGYEYEDGAELPKVEAKPVYNKDDFFDSISSNALDNESQNRRPRFSEQMKLDSETFGEFSRHRGGRGGRWMGRGGRGGRGQNYGRGYNYSGSGRGYGYGSRGRGRGFSSQAS